MRIFLIDGYGPCTIVVFRVLAPSIYVASRDDALELNCYDQHPLSIPFGDIRALTQTADFDVGTLVDGVEDKKARCGVWRNDALGDYTLYGQKPLTHYVIVTTDAQTVAFNYESDAVTDAIFQSLCRALDEKGISYEVD